MTKTTAKHSVIRLVLGRKTAADVLHDAEVSDVTPQDEIRTLVERAVRNGRLPSDDRQDAYSASCEYVGVDA